MQKVGVIAVLSGRHAIVETVIKIVDRIKPGAPDLVREGRVGDHEVEGFQGAVVISEVWIGEGIVAPDFGGRAIVQHHVHFRQGAGGDIFFLTVDGDPRRGFIPRLQQKRTRTASRVIYRLVRPLGPADADGLRHDPRHLGRRVELAFALARFSREVAHQVFIGITEDVVALCPVFAEIKLRAVENRHKV